jgi:hypothetical protein
VDQDPIFKLAGFLATAPGRGARRRKTERAFSTLQDRLPKELALAGVKDIEAANAFIREVYLPALERPLRNEAGRRAKAPSRRWRRPNGATSSCIQEERVVSPDNKSPGTAGACRFRLIPHGARTSCAPRSWVHHYPNGELAISTDHDDWSDGSPVRRTTPFPYRRPREPALAAGEGCGRHGQG